VQFIRKQIIFGLFILNSLNTSGQKTGCLETKAASFINNIKENELEKTYDKNGNLLVYNETTFSNNIKSYSKRTENEYDDKNRLIKTISYINDKLISQSKKQYDSPDFLVKESTNQNSQIITINKNNITEKIYLDENGKQSGKEITQTNLAGNVIKKTVFDDKNNAISEISKIFDKEEKLIESVNDDITAKIKIKTQYEYNSEGSVIKETELLNDGLNYFTLNEYKGSRIFKKIKYNKRSQIEYQIEYLYDELSNLVEEKYFYKSELISTKKNSFDVFEKEDDNSLRSGSYMEKMSAWSVGVGGEYHFAGTEKLSPYGGLDIKFGGGNKTTEGSNGTGTYNPLTGELMGGAFMADHSEASEAKSSSMGVNLVGGVDYYFAESFYLGLELGWGFSSTTWKSGESSATDGIPAVIVKNVTNESKESGMSNNAVAAFRLGWRF